MKRVFLSIDLGTTRLKVAAFEPNGKLLHQRASRHKETATGQDANEWWRDSVRAIGEVTATLQPAEIAGISLSGRGGAAVFADARGQVVAQPWSDQRHRPQLDALMTWRKEHFLANYGASLIAKYQWLLEAEPALAERVTKAFYAKDWLLYRLTGEHLTDWSSGPDRGFWGDAVFQSLSVPRGLLPEPRLPWELAGSLTTRAATELSLPAGIPVAVGAHDGICANIGAGATRPGEYAVTVGTHAVTRTVTRQHPAGAYRFYCLPEDRHIIGGNAIMAGRSADWFLELSHPDLSDRPARFAELDAAAAAVPAGAAGAVFLPFLSGRVAPELRLGASGMFVGLKARHGRAELYRAVLEGAAFAIGDIFRQVEGWCGPPQRIRLTGGGAASAVWANIIAHVLGHPIEISDEAVEGRGAVICLAIALGDQSNYDDAADTMVPITKRIEPDPAAVSQYTSLYERWQNVSALTQSLDRALE